jgi:hypothetical protein
LLIHAAFYALSRPVINGKLLTRFAAAAFVAMQHPQRCDAANRMVIHADKGDIRMNLIMQQADKDGRS